MYFMVRSEAFYLLYRSVLFGVGGGYRCSQEPGSLGTFLETAYQNRQLKKYIF